MFCFHLCCRFKMLSIFLFYYILALYLLLGDLYLPSNSTISSNKGQVYCRAQAGTIGTRTITAIIKNSICLCQRRITHGRISENGRPYMVYLLNSKYSRNQPKNWLCGGALISETQILTSAECLTEVTHMYAIAGYKKYVSGQNIDRDKCTRNRKQKIVEIFIPKAFRKTDSSPGIWVKYDIGLAVVEKPYNFADSSYVDDCSYTPHKIFPYYGTTHERPNTVASIFGWGATRARNKDEDHDLNSEYLHEARTVITNLSFCARYVSDEMKPVVDSALLCAFGTGYSSLREDQHDPMLENCLWRRFDLTNPDDLNLCDDKFNTRRRMLNEKLSRPVNPDESGRRMLDINDAGGICENDRGSPLISYFGRSEVIIGVALTNILFTSRYECEGPYLYVSLAKMGPLLQCLTAKSNETRLVCITLSDESKSNTVDWPDEKPSTKQSKQMYNAHVLRDQALRNTKKQETKRISKQTPRKITKRISKRIPKRTVKYTLKHPNLRMRVTMVSS